MLKKSMMIKYDKYAPESLFLEGYDYSVWSANEEESDIPLLEVGEE